MSSCKDLRGGLMAIMISGLFAVDAFAAATGSIVLGGVVPPVNDLAITSQPGADTLDLSGGAEDQIIAVVNEKNNDPDGYTVTLISANAQAAGSSQPKLNGRQENPSFVSYMIKYGAAGAEAEVVLDSSGRAIVASTTAGSPEGGSTKHLLVAIAPTTSLKADTYSDKLTLTISAK